MIIWFYLEYDKQFYILNPKRDINKYQCCKRDWKPFHVRNDWRKRIFSLEERKKIQYNFLREFFPWRRGIMLILCGSSRNNQGQWAEGTEVPGGIFLLSVSKKNLARRLVWKSQWNIESLITGDNEKLLSKLMTKCFL